MAGQNPATSSKVTENVKTPRNEYVAILLSQILVPWEWNARSYASLLSKKAEGDSAGSTGVLGLSESIKAEGQDTAVDVRLNPDVKSKQPYVLVAGFKRFAAIQRIAETGGRISGDPEWNPLQPTIKAIVHHGMTEAEAENLNLRENTARDDISAPDLMFGLGRMWKRNPNLTQTALAGELNLTQGYIGKLKRIYDGVRADLRDKWRGEQVTLTVDEMLKVKEAHADRQEEVYNELIAKKAEKKTSTKESGRILTANKEKAEAVGKLLGALAEMGFDLMKPDFREYIGSIVKIKSDISDADKASIVEAAAAGYVAGVKSAKKPNIVETPVADNGKAGAPVNGSVAAAV